MITVTFMFFGDFDFDSRWQIIPVINKEWEFTIDKIETKTLK
jgi:hypothetical protein